MNIIKLKKNCGRKIRSGYQWIFSNEIEKPDPGIENGSIIKLIDHQDKLVGSGFFNKNSLISVRLLTMNDEETNSAFFENRIINALKLRELLFKDCQVYRLVFSESDFLPGLIIDRFENDFVIQTNSLGMEQILPEIIKILKKLFNPVSIIEKNESVLRTLEGMEQRKSLLFGEYIPKNLSIDGIQYHIDLLTGQKSGFFLDQRINRTRIRKYCKDSKVIDCFCNEGGFALNAAFSGAKETFGIDISENAINKASMNVELNSLKNNCNFKVADVFKELEEIKNSNEKYDVVILDPPSFTKSKKNIPTAKIGYKKINSLGINILRDGGFLVSSSCSHHIPYEEFISVINEAAEKQSCRLKLLESHSASFDHPILSSMPETRYLKFFVFQVNK